MKPILKWAGGKRNLAEEIVYMFPEDYSERRYHEPMLGGGAIFFRLEPQEGTVNDRNPHLMRFYRVLRDYPDQLIDEASRHEYDEDYYYDARERYNQDSSLSDVERAALFLYFNKTAFNGLWRVNSDGEFNAPIGDYSNPTIVNRDNLRQASEILEGVDLYETDFEYITEAAEEGDLVYFDPPYQPRSDTSDFTGYTKDGFNYDEQERLFRTCRTLDDNGARFVLSNSYVDDIVDLYKEFPRFEVKVVKARRAINSQGDSRGPVKEILVRNVPED